MSDEDQASTPIEELLNRAAGAFARTQEGLAQASNREGIPLHALGDEPPQPTTAAARREA